MAWSLEAGFEMTRTGSLPPKAHIQPQTLVSDHPAMFRRPLARFFLALCKKQSEASFV